MHYIVDGYNFLFRLGEQNGSLENQRETLIETLNDELAIFRPSVSLVFDSAKQMRDAPQRATLSNLEVIYAPKGCSADEYIVELIENSHNPKVLTVVSSDNGLCKQCQHLGAKTLSSHKFLQFVIKKNRQEPSCKPSFRESSKEIERFLQIFEKKLETD